MPDDNNYTEDPDLFESDLRFRAPIYAEEAGRQKEKAMAPVLAPCPTCGEMVIAGETPQGALVTVEPQAQVYTLIWHRGAPWPRLMPSRGYVAHLCQGTTRS